MSSFKWLMNSLEGFQVFEIIFNIISLGLDSPTFCPKGPTSEKTKGKWRRRCSCRIGAFIAGQSKTDLNWLTLVLISYCWRTVTDLQSSGTIWRNVQGLGMAMRMRLSASTSALSDNITLYPTYVGYIRHTHRCASENISAWPSLTGMRFLILNNVIFYWFF